MTLIAASIAVDRPDGVSDALVRAAQARAEGADLVEWRMDMLAAEPGAVEAARRLVRESQLPCIVTVRTALEGGGWDGDETDRISFFEALCTGEHPPRYIDIELSSLERSANLRQKALLCVAHPGQVRDGLPGLIVSAHDFAGRPDDLTRKVAQMWHDPACAVAKVAWRARSLRDVTEAVELLAMRSKPTAAICMGEFGLMTRVLAPKFGALLAYAHVDGDGATAPGQPSVRELVQEWRIRSIGRETAVYGVIGWPVAHSRSPELHNAWFAAHALDARYVPMPVAPGWESFKATVSELRACAALGLRGASVTHPHKENLVRYVRECGGEVDATSAAIGASNTLAIDADGAVRAVNTDAPAVANVMRGMSQGAGWRGARIGVIGAGGAARAAAYAMAMEGSDVTILARRPDQASAAAADLSARAVEATTGAPIGTISGGALQGMSAGSFDAIINATPVGMKGGPDESTSPLPDASALQPGTAVLDMVSVPEETPLVRQARARGTRVATGMALLIAQARRQFIEWTGIDPGEGAPNSVSAKGATVHASPLACMIALAVAAICAVTDPFAAAAARTPARGGSAAHLRAPEFGMQVDPILFGEVRTWCGELVAISPAEWPDVCAAHRDYLASWAAQERQRSVVASPTLAEVLDSRAGIDGAFLDRLRALLGDTSVPALESWRRARRCAMAEQLARESGGAVDAIRASARDGVPFELSSAVASYARISEDCARALVELRSRADSGEDVEDLRSAERAIRRQWLDAEASLAADCVAAGPRGDPVLRAMCIGAYPDLTREWTGRAQLMRLVVERLPATEPRARDAAVSAVDAYTVARWAVVDEEVKRRRAAGTRHAASASRPSAAAGEAVQPRAAARGAAIESLLTEEDAALLAALAESVGAARAQAIRALAYAELEDSVPTIARIVGEDGAVEVLDSLPASVMSGVAQRSELPPLRTAAYALPDVLSPLQPPLTGIGARVCEARAQDAEDRRALEALARDDAVRWSRDVVPALEQRVSARDRAEQAVRTGDLAAFDAAAAAFLALEQRCLDAVARHDAQTWDALERLAARPGSVPAWVSQIRLARSLELQAPRAAALVAFGTGDGEPISVDLRSLAKAVGDPDAWDTLDPAARALIEAGLARALPSGASPRRAALEAAIDAERARIRADLALRDVDALVRQHGSPPAGDPAAFAIQQARTRSAAAGAARAQAVTSATQADAQAALMVMRALQDALSREGDTVAAWQAQRFLVAGALASAVPEWSATRALLIRSERSAWCDALDGESARPASQLWSAAGAALGQSDGALGGGNIMPARVDWRTARSQLEQSAQRMMFMASMPGLKAPVSAPPVAGRER